MAVFEGVRPRTIALPRAPRGTRTIDVPVLPRRRARAAVRANRGPNRLALVLGAIVVAFMLAFFSLAQEVRVSATSYDIGQLTLDRDRLLASEQELRSDLSRLGREPAVRKQALDAGLTQLAEPIVLPAR